MNTTTADQITEPECDDCGATLVGMSDKCPDCGYNPNAEADRACANCGSQNHTFCNR